MRRDAILRRLRERPFKPSSIRLSNGTVHDIHHPEWAMVTSTSVIVGLPPAGGPVSGELEDYAVIAPDHVVQIDPITAFPTSPPNREASAD